MLAALKTLGGNPFLKNSCETA